MKLKVIAWTLVLSFALEQVVHAAPGVIKPITLDIFQKPLVSFKLPDTIALIEDSYLARGIRGLTPQGSVPKTAPKTIILIQDAHTNESGQINVSKTLDLILQKEKDIKYIFLEAGQGNESISFLRRLVPLDERKRVGMFFLRKGKLQGSEYLDLTKDHNITLWGVEEMDLYTKAWNSYKTIAKERDTFQTYLQRIEITIKTLKPKLYNPSLLSFDEKHESFLKEEVSLTDYLSILMDHKNTGKYKHLQRLKKLKNLEANIDFEKANEEQMEAIESLPQDQKTTLSPQRLSSQKWKERSGFYTHLEHVMKENADKSKYPELFKYIRYLKKAKNIDPKAILQEQKTLEIEVFNHLAQTPDEHELVKASRNIRDLKKLLNLTLTPEEYQTYQKDPQGFAITHITGFLNKKIMDLKKHYENALFLEEGYEDLIQHCETFYNLTVLRDQAFISNMFTKMDKENQTKAILITGGYHTPNLKYLLKKHNASFISITPQVFHETDHIRYERLLLSQKMDDRHWSMDKEGKSMIEDVSISKNTMNLTRPYLPKLVKALGLSKKVITLQDRRSPFYVSPILTGARLAEEKKDEEEYDSSNALGERIKRFLNVTAFVLSTIGLNNLTIGIVILGIVIRTDNFTPAIVFIGISIAGQLIYGLFEYVLPKVKAVMPLPTDQVVALRIEKSLNELIEYAVKRKDKLLLESLSRIEAIKVVPDEKSSYVRAGGKEGNKILTTRSIASTSGLKYLIVRRAIGITYDSWNKSYPSSDDYHDPGDEHRASFNRKFWYPYSDFELLKRWRAYPAVITLYVLSHMVFYNAGSLLGFMGQIAESLFTFGLFESLRIYDFAYKLNVHVMQNRAFIDSISGKGEDYRIPVLFEGHGDSPLTKDNSGDSLLKSVNGTRIANKKNELSKLSTEFDRLRDFVVKATAKVRGLYRRLSQGSEQVVTILLRSGPPGEYERYKASMGKGKIPHRLEGMARRPWPIKMNDPKLNAQLLNLYGERRRRNTPLMEDHYEVDISVPAGTNVSAVEDGIVIYVNRSLAWAGKLADIVIYAPKSNLIWGYLHLAPDSISEYLLDELNEWPGFIDRWKMKLGFVNQRARVKAGESIGRVGELPIPPYIFSGKRMDHLHLEASDLGSSWHGIKNHIDRLIEKKHVNPLSLLEPFLYDSNDSGARLARTTGFLQYQVNRTLRTVKINEGVGTGGPVLMRVRVKFSSTDDDLWGGSIMEWRQDNPKEQTIDLSFLVNVQKFDGEFFANALLTFIPSLDQSPHWPFAKETLSKLTSAARLAANIDNDSGDSLLIKGARLAQSDLGRHLGNVTVRELAGQARQGALSHYVRSNRIKDSIAREEINDVMFPREIALGNHLEEFFRLADQISSQEDSSSRSIKENDFYLKRRGETLTIQAVLLGAPQEVLTRLKRRNTTRSLMTKALRLIHPSTTWSVRPIASQDTGQPNNGLVIEINLNSTKVFRIVPLTEDQVLGLRRIAEDMAKKIMGLDSNRGRVILVGAVSGAGKSLVTKHGVRFGTPCESHRDHSF